MIVRKIECNTSFGIKKNNTYENYNRDSPRVKSRTFPVFIYIIDLPEYAKNNNQIAMFTDDTFLVKAGERKKCQIQKDIDRMAV